MTKEIPPAGTPVDQLLYNEACWKIISLEKRIKELEALLESERTYHKQTRKFIE